VYIETYQPCAALAPFVDQYIFHRGYRPGHTRERILAYGAMDLIVDLTERPKATFDNETLTPSGSYRHGWVSGLREGPITIECGSGDPMMVIHLKPGGAWAFFGFPVRELTGHIENLDAIWGRRFDELRDQLLEAPSVTGMFARLETWLLTMAGDRLEVDPFTSYALEVLDTRPRLPSMSALASELGYSQKHMIALFDKRVGLSPKRYARIARFQRIVTALEAGRPASWSDFARDMGFYDQAHFTNEMKAFSGLTPETYLTRKGPFLNFLPAD